MKYILLFFIILNFNISASECEVSHSEGSNKLTICDIKGKKVNFLDVTGSMNDLAYYHGKFLAKDILSGVIASVAKRRDDSFRALAKKERSQFRAIYKCVMNKYKKSVDPKFLSELSYLAKGVRDAGYSLTGKEVIEATLMIEMSGFVDSLNLEMEEDRRGTNWKLIKSCGLHIASASIKNIFSTIGGGFKKMKKGCTGFSASADFTVDGSHLHGRNFDTGFMGVFEKYPVVINHRNSEGVNYMGMSSAGLHYPGGISGMNEYGISISTHELRTKNYKIKYKDRIGAVAPYAANIILSKAKSLDEAITIAKRFGYFGAWSFLVSDSKSGESASIEISGDIVRVAKRSSGSMGQTNHFLHSDTARYNFEYSLNKSLESRARLSLVNDELAQSRGQIDINWGINLLSGHTDYLVGQRSFGRTVSKVYTSMTHIMDTERNIFWFSLGESYPTNLSTFIGLKVYFDQEDNFFTFKGSERNTSFDNSSWKKSLEYFTNAYFAYEGDGDLKSKLTQSYELLRKASSLAKEDNIIEYPYEMMRARVGLKIISEFPDLLDSLELDTVFDTLLSEVGNLHHFEVAQVYESYARYNDLLNRREQASKYFAKAVKELEALRGEFNNHFYFNKQYWTNYWFIKHRYSKYDNRVEQLHFATVE
ncbi:hypothetical protein BIY24_04675 [Halobacteriovorax marinus]|uniref:C45 family autoproteolytic acyltransferase/hydolase n=1 Tax=Halobacteriovorax marinus TaxID=97084 RepID=UPI000BC2F01D|nr:C45 family peptidase [Halobacteriovorax marinus]ATH07253.1 hypothetical protein BIY24_04675 [Halobacteriovorax marinus]